MKLSLLISQLTDNLLQENFRNILNYTQSQPWLQGDWKFYEVAFTTAVTNFRFKHNLAFRPKDILLTAKTGSATVTFNYDLFSSEFLDITTDAATTIRFFAGSYRIDNIQ